MHFHHFLLKLHNSQPDYSNWKLAEISFYKKLTEGQLYHWSAFSIFTFMIRKLITEVFDLKNTEKIKMALIIRGLF